MATGTKSAAGTSSGGRDAPTNIYSIDAEGNFTTNSGDILGIIFATIQLDEVVPEQSNVVVSKFEVIPESGILTVYGSGNRVIGYAVDTNEDENNVDSWVLHTFERHGKLYTYVVTGSSEAPTVQGNLRGESRPRSKYLTKPRDTLVKIAQELLYDARRWKEIYAINKEVIGPDPTVLNVNTVLKIPRR